MYFTTADKIKIYLADNGISIVWLAHKIGMKYKTLYSKLSSGNLHADDIESICYALKREPNDFLSARLPESEVKNAENIS